MKKILFLLSCCAFLFVSSCNKDDDDGLGEVTGTILNFDGDNASGPLLPAGSYETAVRFPASQMGQYSNAQIKEIRWFMGAKPDNCSLKIYNEGTDNTPGTLLYEASVNSQIESNTQRWYSHELSSVLNADGGDLWVSVSFDHPVEMQSMGCDAGPRRDNGDWILDPLTATDWRTYAQRSSESINWNLRIVVE